MISLGGGLAALALLVLAAVLGRHRRARTKMRLEALVRELDECLGSLASALDRALENASATQDGHAGLGLTLDLDELLTRIAAEAAARTGAEARRSPRDPPGERCRGRLLGVRGGRSAAGGDLASPGRRDFRALTINWTLPPSSDGFRSALVVPIVEEGAETGAIVSAAREPAAFRPEHARTLEALSREAAAGIATARRFGAVRRRTREIGPRAVPASQPPRDSSHAL